MQGAHVNRRTGTTVLMAWTALAFLLPGTDAAAAAPTAKQALPDQELDEVTVNGNRINPTRNMRTILEWLVRLVGQYRYEGSVELKPGPGVPAEKLPVRGVGDCVRFGIAPGVQCSVAIRWPEVHGEDGAEVVGGVSSLNPAMILYGLDPDRRGIHFLQVDSRGIADGGVGYLTGDTLETSASCEGIPGDCQRITRINAEPEGKLIQMQVDIQQDGVRTARFNFVMHRQPQQSKEPRR
jgi:hypothetical protein